MISWGLYSATVKKIEEWNYPTAAVTRRIYFYGIIFLIPVLISQHAMWDMDALKRPEVISNFLFLGVGASAVGFFPLEFIDKMDWSRQDQCIYLCFPCHDGSIINVCIG